MAPAPGAASQDERLAGEGRGYRALAGAGWAQKEEQRRPAWVQVLFGPRQSGPQAHTVTTPTEASAEAPGGREGGGQSNMAGPGTTSSGPAWGPGAQEEPEPRMLTGSGARASSAPFDGCLVGKGALQGVRQRALCDDLLSERASLQLPQPLEESKGNSQEGEKFLSKHLLCSPRPNPLLYWALTVNLLPSLQAAGVFVISPTCRRRKQKHESGSGGLQITR